MDHNLPRDDRLEDDDPWAASDGLPEVADDFSYADGVHESARDRDVDLETAIPPDRDDGPLALDDFGVTSAERTRGEPLTARLHRELPDVGDGLGRGDWRSDEPNPRLAQDLDQDVPGQLDADDEALAAEPIDPRLDSHVSMYDRTVPGIPDHEGVGELVRPGSGYRSVTTDEIAYDLGGVSLGGLGGEERAMHGMPEDELDLEEAQSTHEPYVARERGAPVRTGAEQPWDPADLAVAEGHDPTPQHVEHARRELREEGPAAIEKTVP